MEGGQWTICCQCTLGHGYGTEMMMILLFGRVGGIFGSIWEYVEKMGHIEEGS